MSSMKQFNTFLLVYYYLDTVYALIDITSTSYTNVNEGLSSITASDIWVGLCITDSCNTINLSYNSFTSTDLSAINFRLIDGDNLENRVKYLDLSHNQIVDISLQVFVYRAGVQEDSAWTIITLDLSYNKISDVSSFPSSLMRGSFKKLFLQHNQIVQLGTTTPNALQGITVGAFEELNLEFNQITQMPYLNFDGSPSQFRWFSFTIAYVSENGAYISGMACRLHKYLP